MEEGSSISKIKKPSFILSVRFLMSVMLFAGWGLNYMQKIDMGLAIVCMVNHTATKPQTNNYLNQSINSVSSKYKRKLTTNPLNGCPIKKSFKSKKVEDGPFVWDKYTQGIILSSFFYGYMLTQFAGGWLSYKFGANLMIVLSIGIGSILTMLIPVCARWSYKALIACLFLGGGVHGIFIPSTGTFWAPWAPTPERSRLIGISYSGANLGKILALSIGGFLCVYGFDGGWPSIFYLIGIAGVIWAILFFLISSQTPDTHRFISQKEKDYIKSETLETLKASQMKLKIPWLEIFKTKACYSIYIGNFTHNWGVFLFLTEIPSYLKDVYEFDVKANGLISSIPYVASWIFIYIASFLSDMLIKSNRLSLTTIRRISTGLGTYGTAAVIIGLAFVDCSRVYLGISLLTLGVALISFMSGAGFIINVNDISGPFSGIIFGISNTFGSSAAILGPYTTGLLTTNHSAKEWQVVFLICALINIVGGTICIILLDANVQPWAKVNIKEENQLKTNNNYNSENVNKGSEKNN